MSPILVDTNVLVYAHDPGEPDKHARALAVLDRLQATDAGRLSVQCLSEFFVATTRAPDPRLTIEEASLQVERLARAWRVFNVTPLILGEAVRGVRQYRLSFRDAQIWACARLNQVPVLFTEDFTDGRVLEGVRYVDPFGALFSLDDWC